MNKLTKTGIALLVISFGIAFYQAGTEDEKTSRQRGMQKAVLGSILTLNTKIDEKSISGYHLVPTVSAWIADVVDNQIHVQADATQERPWPDEIMIETITVKGVPVITGREAISPTIQIVVPHDASLLGKEGHIVVQGTVIFPYLTYGEVALGAHGLDQEYEVKEAKFEQRIPVVFVATNAEENSASALIGFCFIAGILVLIVAGIRRLVVVASETSVRVGRELAIAKQKAKDTAEASIATT